MGILLCCAEHFLTRSGQVRAVKHIVPTPTTGTRILRAGSAEVEFFTKPVFQKLPEISLDKLRIISEKCKYRPGGLNLCHVFYFQLRSAFR